MKLYEIITLVAILVGPVLAVLVQLRAESRKQTRDQQTITMRMLASTRHLPADPAYSTTINMIPIDFNRVPKVMEAHKAYIELINVRPTSENQARHDEQHITKQTKLLFAMTQHPGYNLPETDIQTTAYAAGGFIERDNLMLNAWGAWPRIADALEKQTEWVASQQTDEEK